MTRKEEREQASFEYHSKPYLRAIKDDFVNGAEWADETLLGRVCDWIEDNIYDYLYINRDFNEADYKHEFIEDLRKAVKE